MNEDIIAAIRDRIPDAEVDVLLDGNLALITVVSTAFEDLSRVRKQQLVYGCIEDYIRDGRLHAVTIRAQTPAEASG